MKRLILLAILVVSLGAGVVVRGEDDREMVIPPSDTFDGQPMDINMDDVRLLAGVIWAEAEGEDQTGKRLVASTVLNRVDDPRFPNSISEVIYQPGQFTVVWNGRLDTGIALQEPSCVTAAIEELTQRTDQNVLFFCAGGWGYGTPYLQHGSHYFSTLWR